MIYNSILPFCFFSSISRWRRSSSCFLRSANFFSSSARVTFLLACFSFSLYVILISVKRLVFFEPKIFYLLSSSSSLARCLRHSWMYSRSCSSKSDLFWSCFLMNSGSPDGCSLTRRNNYLGRLNRIQSAAHECTSKIISSEITEPELCQMLQT